MVFWCSNSCAAQLVMQHNSFGAAQLVLQHNSCGAAQIIARVTTLAASQFRFTASPHLRTAFPPKLNLITCSCCLSGKTRHLLFSNLTILFIFPPGLHNGPYLAVAKGSSWLEKGIHLDSHRLYFSTPGPLFATSLLSFLCQVHSIASVSTCFLD